LTDAAHIHRIDFMKQIKVTHQHAEGQQRQQHEEFEHARSAHRRDHHPQQHHVMTIGVIAQRTRYCYGEHTGNVAQQQRTAQQIHRMQRRNHPAGIVLIKEVPNDHVSL
jgi:hypothetical protein